jgi:hypothetical protein
VIRSTEDTNKFKEIVKSGLFYKIRTNTTIVDVKTMYGEK